MPQVGGICPPEHTGSVLVILLITQQVLGVSRLADTARKKGAWGNVFCPSQVKVEVMLGCDCSRNHRTTETLRLEKTPKIVESNHHLASPLNHVHK